MMSSDDDDDDTTDYDSFDTTTDDDDDDDDDDISDGVVQPINFRECLRLLDAALTASHQPILPRWCTSEKIDILDDPMLIINGYRRHLSLPLNKQQAKRIIQIAEPLDMKIDIVDGIVFSPTAYQLAASSFRLTNPEWQSKIENILKESCVSRTFQIDSKEIQLRISHLVLLESCPFPRQFTWKKEQASKSTIAKLFLSLPSSSKGGKETISYLKEKHIFDLSEKDCKNSYFFSLVPFSDECQHEIDLISNGHKLILIYDVISLKATCLYNVTINETVLERISRVLDTWMCGLENHFHGYSSKIVVPFSDSFHAGNNPLLHGIDRVIGTILCRSLQRYYGERCLLYQGIIRPNRFNNGTEHVCRLITDLTLMTNNQGEILFDQIDSCLGNCNETYSGNIFLRQTFSEQGNPIAIEQYVVPVWCLVPTSHKYDLFIDQLPSLFAHLEQNLLPSIDHRQQVFTLVNWLLTTSKKIHFNAKILLHQLLRLKSNHNIDQDLLIIIRKLFGHKKFLEQFIPMNHKQEYDDIVDLLKCSKETEIQLNIHQVLRIVLKRRSHDNDRIKETIKFIGILATENVDKEFLFVLIHELLTNVFHSNHLAPSLTDLINLLALLSVFIDVYEPSCEIIAQQIIHQINITKTTTTSTSTTTNLLRTVLIPTLIYIYRHWTDENERSSSNSRKRKRDTIQQFPSWFVSLYQTCRSLLDNYCNSRLPIPFYSNLSHTFHSCRCSVCHDLIVFLENMSLVEQTFLIPNRQIYHFCTIVQKFNPLIILTESMTSDQRFQKVTAIKMSKYDEEQSRESKLLYSLLRHIPIDDDTKDSSLPKSQKRFKILQ